MICPLKVGLDWNLGLRLSVLHLGQIVFRGLYNAGAQPVLVWLAASAGLGLVVFDWKALDSGLRSSAGPPSLRGPVFHFGGWFEWLIYFGRWLKRWNFWSNSERLKIR